MRAKALQDFKGYERALLVMVSAEEALFLAGKLARFESGERLSEHDMLVWVAEGFPIRLTRAKGEALSVKTASSELIFSGGTGVFRDIGQALYRLSESSEAGHFFVDSIGDVDQVIVSKGEYPES